ncbi:PKD domain containing protein [Spirosoma linguale DSM 74]|uniref:PKD domain containing protein n=2 Tax=Spirosoma TaxID=107 RepID=D2QRF1_SPILD|nr:PKD domain containing protein [Spirosoma linguale DSM 74]
MNHIFGMYLSVSKFLPTRLFNSIVCFTLLLAYISTNSLLVAQQLPPGFSKSVSQSGYVGSVGMVFAKDGNSFFVWEKSGLVWASVWNGTSYNRQESVTLDIREEVGEWNDFGLHSMCLDPNFETNGFIYLFYVVDLHHLLYFGTSQYSSTANEYQNATVSRVTRYKLNKVGTSYLTDYSSRTVLLGESKTTGVPITFESHAGGTILFGNDGSLLVATGDGAHHEGIDVGNDSRTNFQTALNLGIMRPEENVGALRSQMLNSHCGKVLRIDPTTGNGLPSNPFYDPMNPRAPKSRVWTLGVRNPYRICIQPNTGSTNPDDGSPGTLLIGDVGWFKWEDFHVIDKAGLNCGWPVYEGLLPTYLYYGTNVHNLDEPGQPTFESLCVQPSSFIDNPDPTLRRFTHSRPAMDYSHSANITRVPAFNGTTAIVRELGTVGAPAGTQFLGHCAIGGAYYTGTQFPAMYQNTLFFTDYVEGWIKSIVLHDEGDHHIHEIKDFASLGFDTNILDLKVNPRDGSLYYVRLDGVVSRISYGGNQPPVANATASANYGLSPLVIQFTGSNSVDPEGQALSYLWKFGDGTTSTSANPVKTFTAVSTQMYTVTLVVTDNEQLTSSQEVIISVNNTPPAVEIVTPASGTLYRMDQATTYTLQAAVTDTDTAGMQYAWQVTLRHNSHTHPEPILYERTPTVTITPAGCNPNETFYYVIIINATDNGGLTATQSLTLNPDCSSANVAVTNLQTTSKLNSVLVSWINPNVTFDEVMVVAKEATGFRGSPSGTSYTAKASFTSDGTAFEAGKVVYRGQSNSVTVTNLDPLKQYYFRVYTRVGNVWNAGVQGTATPNLPPIAPVVVPPAAELYTLYSYTVPVFTDPENQPLTATTSLPDWLTYDADTGVLTGVPVVAGSYTLTIGVTDPGNLTARVVMVVVAGPNQPPVPPVVGEQFAQIGRPFSFTVPAFTDPEGKALAYASGELPYWLSFDTNTRVMSGTPTQTNSYSVTIHATDPQGLTASVRVVINAGICTMATVKQGNWNDPTVWYCQRIPTGAETVYINHAVTVPTGYDAYAKSVVYAASGSLAFSENARLNVNP